MNFRSLLLLAALSGSMGLAAQQVEAPQPVGPLPTKYQVEWQKMDTYAFIHFGPNTFLDREWGYGDAPLSCFNPTRLDAEQWARTIKAAGMKGVIITAKHHDGFCLWPTKYTDYSVRNTPFRDGKGDVVGELAAAARKYGLKFGVYLSPWDRHQAFYGTPLYVEYWHAQLDELMSNYGELFEIWFDGANGGDGWYGGARETRTIDRRTYYDYPRAEREIAAKQPQAIIFSDNGPGCRWVGNERGYANATNWSLLRRKEVFPGYNKSYELQSGHEDGDHWIPAECDVSIRPGWFFHESQDNQVKSVDQLVDLYYRSVGHNAHFLLNLPVNKEGLVSPTDSANMVNAYKKIAAELKTNLVRGAKVQADKVRGKAFAAQLVADDNYDTYWATPDGENTGTLTITFKKAQKLNRLLLQEYIPLGQRVRSFVAEYYDGKQWQPLRMNEETTTIGYKRILRFKTVEARKVRVRITDARGPLCISEVAAYYAPGAKDQYVERAADLKGYDYKVAEQTAQSVTLDLGQAKSVHALHYQPAASGLITHYQVLIGNDLNDLRKMAEGEFSNIVNNPILQDVYFVPTQARYVRLVATKMARNGESLKYDKLVVN